MNAVEVYPASWDQVEDELQEEYRDYYEGLCEFVGQTSIDGHSLRINMQ